MKLPNCHWCGEEFAIRSNKETDTIETFYLKCANVDCDFMPMMRVNYKTPEDAIGAATLPNPNFPNGFLEKITAAHVEMTDTELKANREMILSQEMTMEEFNKFMRA